MGRQILTLRRIGYIIRNIGHWTLPNIWVGIFLVRNVHLKERSELILTVKIEIKHPVEGQFGSEFPASDL